MEHTKEKWEVIQEGLDPTLPDKGYLSIQPIDAYIDHGSAPITDEDRANAQLIATAPDLLKALKNGASPDIFAQFAQFANFAEECMAKPSMAIYKTQFAGLATFLISCVGRSEEALQAIAEAEKEVK